MTRYRAAAIHLIASASIGTAVFAAVWIFIYPAPLLAAVGGLQIFLLLLVVDVVLGPLLTLVVFRKGKPSLILDLSVIAAVQAIALAYGLNALYAGRPVYVAALGPRFQVVTANEVSDADLDIAGQSLPRFGPVLVGVKQPTDPKERERVMFSALTGADLGHFPQYHQPIENMRDRILADALPIAELKRLNRGEETAIDIWLQARGVSEAQVRFQGLRARAKDMAVIVDARTAKIIGIAPFEPWH